MTIAAHQLEAFWAVAESLRFSRAAERLHLTQPALSHRIKLLEAAVGKRLFVRGTGASGVRLTDAGERLLRYCKTQRALEAELVADLEGTGKAPGLGGNVRIAGFSSVMRSCVVPSLASLYRNNPALSIEVFVREMHEIAELLSRGLVDFALLDHAVVRPDVEHRLLGHEELVLVESTKHRSRDEVYLDHDPDDPTTVRFLKRKSPIARSFFDDIYGILDGVEEGYGRAVVPKHLVVGRPRLTIVRHSKMLRSPVVLHGFRQSAHTRAHDAVLAAMTSGVPAILDRTAG